MSAGAPAAANAAFIVLPLLLATLLVWGTWHVYRGRAAVRMALLAAAGSAVWMLVTWVAAARGILREWDATPPPFGFLLVGIAALALLIALTPFGRRLATLPLWVLVLVQAFRLPLELAMHAVYERGIMPVQMSYSGLNFDIATGASALIVAAVARTGRWRGAVWAWNAMGLLLVLNVATIGVLSTPRFRLFGEDRLNVWITYPPYVWLPAVMVLAAVAGHLVIFRALRRSQ